MEVVAVLHNTPEWLAFRKSGIGGSEAAAILGENPYKTAMELWEEKTGRAEPKAVSSNKMVEYGRAAEEPLVTLFALDFPQYEVIDRKDVVFVEGCMFASLDSELLDKATGRKGILEVKTTEIFGSMREERWNGQIPQNYFIQVLHYLAVTGYDFAVLKAQLKSTDKDGNVYLRTKHYHIERVDTQDSIDYLVAKEREFWRAVREDKRPTNYMMPSI